MVAVSDIFATLSIMMDICMEPHSAAAKPPHPPSLFFANRSSIRKRGFGGAVSKMALTGNQMLHRPRQLKSN